MGNDNAVEVSVTTPFEPSPLELIESVANTMSYKFSKEEWPMIRDLFDIAIKEGLDFGSAMRWAIKTYYGWE